MSACVPVSVYVSVAAWRRSQAGKDRLQLSMEHVCRSIRDDLWVIEDGGVTGFLDDTFCPAELAGGREGYPDRA